MGVCVRAHVVKCVLTVFMIENDFVTKCDFRQILCSVIDHLWVHLEEGNHDSFRSFSE